MADPLLARRLVLAVTSLAIPKFALAQGGNSGDTAVQAVLRSIDEIAVRQANTFIAKFALQTGTRPPPPTHFGFVQPLTPAPAEPTTQSGLIKIEVWGPPVPNQIPPLPGSEWTMQVNTRVKGYTLDSGRGWERQRLQPIYYLQWTVVSAAGNIKVLVRSYKESTGKSGIPDDGICEYVAAILSVSPDQVHLMRPTGS